MWLLAALSLPACSDGGAPNEQDPNGGTDSDTDSDADTDVDDPCNDPEPWIEHCGAAESAAACDSVADELPRVAETCDCDDCWHTCSWIPAVETGSNPLCGYYGTIKMLCMYLSGGEESTGSDPPCPPANDNTAFVYLHQGATYTGYAWGNPEALDQYSLTPCDPDTGSPYPVCSCICEEDFPIQDLNDY
jgi:hypothetical protein